jgi:hypothetical protein
MRNWAFHFQEKDDAHIEFLVPSELYRSAQRGILPARDGRQ